MIPSQRRMLEEIERDERWLAGFPTPAASPELVERITGQVRGEAVRQRNRPSALAWSRVAGTFAAAASIALAVWIGLSDWGDDAAERVAVVGESSPVEALVAGSENAVGAMAKLDEGLDDLESWSDDAVWDLDGTALAEALDESYRDASNGTSG